MDKPPLPPTWNPKGVTRTELNLLGLASVDEAGMRRRQKRFLVAGVGLMVAAVAVAVVDDAVALDLLALAVLPAMAGVLLVLRSFEMRRIRTTRRVLRRLCGLDAE